MAHADEVIGFVGVDIVGRGAQGAGRDRRTRVSNGTVNSVADASLFRFVNKKNCSSAE